MIDQNRNKKELWVIRKLARLTIAKNLKYAAEGMTPSDRKDFQLTIAYAWNNALIEMKDKPGDVLDAMRSLHERGIRFDAILQASEIIFQEELRSFNPDTAIEYSQIDD